jgi:hypothetical protein
MWRERRPRHRPGRRWGHGFRAQGGEQARRASARAGDPHKCINALRAGCAQLTFTRFSAKGRPLMTASWARRTLAAATSFMAEVIFWVFFTELMLRGGRRAASAAAELPGCAPPSAGARDSGQRQGPSGALTGP